MPSTESRFETNTLKAALSACRRHWLYAGVFSAVINLLYIAPTVYMLQVYDRVVPTRGSLTLAFLTVLLLASLATLALLELLRSRLLIRASSRLEKLLAAPILRAAMLRRGPGSPQAIRDFDALRQTLCGAGVLALFDVPWTPVYVLLCFALNPLLGLMAVTGSAALIGLALVNEHVVRPKLNAANAAAAHGYESQAQVMALSDVVHALGMREAVVHGHLRQRAAVNGLQSQASFSAGGFVGLTKFIRLSLQSLALGLAAYLAINQQISAGAIFAASLLISRALAPVEQVLASWRSLTEARNAYSDLREVLQHAERDTAPRTLLPAPTGVLTVDRLTVSGAAGRAPRLNGVSFELQPGQVMGVVGPSGAGKSTLLRALVGAQSPDDGSIRLDGAEISAWEPDRLGRHIGYLPQELGLLQGTVKQNICRFRDASEHREDIDRMTVEAAMAAGVHELILNLPQGYDTRIEWGGRGLSLGQAQRVALARALFGDPRLVILDEPNAHLDVQGDAALLRAIDGLKRRGAAVILVTHRPSLLETIDRLLVLVNGAVVQLGARDEVFRTPIGGPKAPLQSQPQEAA